MSEADRIANLEKRVARLEATKSATLAIVQRIAELVKGIGSKLAELTEQFK